MKKGFTLIETIAAITILSFVMVTLLQIKENNIFYLQKIDESMKKDMDIALAAGLSDFNTSSEEQKLYIKDLIKIKDDEIRKKVKDMKVVKNIEELPPLEFESDEFPIKVFIYEQQYELQDGSNKKLYTFTLE